jgi:hypothetical protein
MTTITKTTEEQCQIERLDFEIDKTHQTLYQAGEQVGKAFLIYLICIGITALLIFGRGIKDEVSVPFLQLTLDKSNATLVIHILSIGVLFWYHYIVAYEQFLLFQVADLLHERYGYVSSPLSLHYPALPTVTTKLMLAFFRENFESGLGCITGFLWFVPTVLILLLTIAVPLYFTWRIGAGSGLLMIQKMLLLLATAFIIAIPVFVQNYLPWHRDLKAKRKRM